MGQMTKLDPNVTNQLLKQPGSNPGKAPVLQIVSGCTPACHLLSPLIASCALGLYSSAQARALPRGSQVVCHFTALWV